jgi:DNA-binding CsgD family transcriptional regulator
MPGEYWTNEQIESLLQQVVIEQKPLAQLRVNGKSMAAINNQRRRLKEAGLLQKAFVGRKLVPWTICELRQLINLTREHGFSANFIAQLQLIPGRSEYAISKMMGRHGLGNPAVKARAQAAQRLGQQQRRELERFLRQEGRFYSSAEVARQWGLAQQTVNGHRRRLGVPLSWQQARASEEHRRYQEMRRRGFAERLSNRWEEWRLQRGQRLRALQSELERSPNQPARRRCANCGEHWFATRDFFYVASRRRGNSSRFSMSRACRICRSVQRRAERGRYPKSARTV